MQSYLNAVYSAEDKARDEVRVVAVIPHLLRLLQTAKIQIDRDEVTLLSHKRLAFLVFFTEQLVAVNRLEQYTFQQLLHRVNVKKPKAHIHPIIKIDGANRELFTDNNGIAFYQNYHALKNTDLEGGDGKVVAGFANEHDEQPIYAIKWMHPNRTLEARKEVRYQFLLNRMPAHLLSYKGHFAVIMEWRNGVKVKDVPEDKYKAIPIERRIHCLISLLVELNQLHTVFRIHCDLFDINILIDFNTDTMSLVDFSNCYRAAPSFFTKFETHSLTAILEKIFPDASTCQTHLHSAMQHIITLTQHRQPPSSLQLLRFCRELTEKSHQLDETILHKLIDKTFTPPHLTFEDILRGSL